MKTLEFLLTVVFVGAVGAVLLGGIAVVLSVYIHIRTRVADDLSARWYAKRPRRMRRPRRMDAYFAEQRRVQRDFNERWFRLGMRLVPVLAVAFGVIVLTGVALTLLD